MQRTSNLITIQYLRCIACIGVAVYHIGEIFQYHLEFGTVGVDIFFVVSGFIMWMVSRQRETSPYRFAKKRIIRIVPLYWLVTLFVAVGALIRPNLFPTDHPSITHVALSMLFIPHRAADGSLYPLIGQGWTLNYEFFFYGIFTLTLMLPQKLHLTVLSTVLIACVVSGYLLNPASPAGMVYTSPLLTEFLLGIWICKLWSGDNLLKANSAWVCLLLCICWIGAQYFFHLSQLPRFVVSGIPAALIVFSAISLERHCRIPRIKVLKQLGDASYSIYLTHYISWLAMSILAAKLGLHLGLPVYLATVSASLIAGVAVWELVEKPFGKFAAKW